MRILLVCTPFLLLALKTMFENDKELLKSCNCFNHLKREGERENIARQTSVKKVKKETKKKYERIKKTNVS